MPTLATSPSPTPTDTNHQASSASHWLANNPGRIAPDAYSWMQAVHWFHDDDAYAPDRTHGPQRFTRTTLRLAVVLARLKECRPGVDNLASWLGVSKRTVQYHLGILRDVGLLAYASKGTRIAGVGGRASEFTRMVPPSFDDALGMRTAPSAAYIRSVRGIDEARRPLIARLGRKARQSLNQKRTKASKRTSTSRASCTPRGVSRGSSSPTGSTSLPSEAKLGAGKHTSTPATKPQRQPRKANAVGQRFRLAAELIRRVPWMHRASTPRIAWIVRSVADAGWTADEVIALLDCGEAPSRVHRPSGLLASRLRGAVDLWPDAAGRARAVEASRDSRRAEQARHTEWEGAWQAPTSMAVRVLVEKALAPTTPSPRQLETLPELHAVDQLSDAEVTALRAEAHGRFLTGDTSLIRVAVDCLGQTIAQRLYGPELVQRALQLAAASSLTTFGAR
ncbi:transcriptional regulator [Streptomyces xantholiticus]